MNMDGALRRQPFYIILLFFKLFFDVYGLNLLNHNTHYLYSSFYV